ncbi:MAG: hypothetical protein HONBIEJF_00867 [Fimbriimonadaceae bacterium]|nr:hypothetical protein [Fimbriimonadaceae bacterium]
MLATLLGFVIGLQQQQPQPPLENLQLVMLMTAKEAPKVEGSALQRMQGEHLKYLESLWAEGKALLVGPITDGKDLRGILILKAKDKDEAKSWMDKDPFVRSGQLSPAVYDLWMQTYMIKKAPKFLDLDTFAFAFYRRPENAPDYDEAKLQEIQKGHMAHLGKMAKDNGLLAAGPLGGAGARRGILIFRKADKDAIRKACSEDPAVKAGRLEVEPYTWLTSKGTFGDK